MSHIALKGLAMAMALGVGTLSLPDAAEAGRRGDAFGAGLLGFGIGAVVGSALTPREVYVVPPPPPPPVYYAPASYGPPPWTPEWYAYCGSRYRSFDPRSGYFYGYDGVPRFCR
jgi:hypothetical protein